MRRVASDLYDVLAYIAYAAVPISRIDRVIAHKSLIFSGQSHQIQEIVYDLDVKIGSKIMDRRN
jgi:type I restriction enzyme, R subunit